MFGGFPSTGDKKIALVLELIFEEIRLRSKFKVSHSISIKIGFNPF